jgi:hypothetical protein
MARCGFVTLSEETKHFTLPPHDVELFQTPFLVVKGGGGFFFKEDGDLTESDSQL